MAAKLKDIAEQAGVSITTVSLILNKRPGLRVTDVVRSRVLRIAEELEYTPNRVAQRLVGGRTKTVALLLHNVRNDFFCAYLEAIEANLAPHEYHTVPFESRALPERADQVLELIDGRVCDALISLEYIRDQPVPRRRNDPFPMVLRQEVFGDATPPMRDVKTLQVDYQPALAALCSHFRDMGATKVGVLTKGWTDLALPAARRSPRGIAFERFLSEAGLYRDPSQCIALDFHESLPEWAEITRQLFTRQPDIDCLLVHNAMVLPPVLHVLSELGRVPGRDISVATFDDPPSAEWTCGGVTVVRETITELAAVLADMTLGVLGLLKSNSETRRVEAELILRNSSRLLK